MRLRCFKRDAAHVQTFPSEIVLLGSPLHTCHLYHALRNIGVFKEVLIPCSRVQSVILQGPHVEIRSNSVPGKAKGFSYYDTYHSTPARFTLTFPNIKVFRENLTPGTV